MDKKNKNMNLRAAILRDMLHPFFRENPAYAKPKKPGEIPQPEREPETEPAEEPAPPVWPRKEPEITPGHEPLTIPPSAPPDVPAPPQKSLA